ncbi:zinc-binding dehydrogenase [Actinomadura sp. ATCC 31491]|uniref:Zinc-binding dehydrogenase n=1 Tax=Actinomadura luzonensis TaxID=2805427 RepID=A0ABT0FQ38_9ACTN|nr:zinc-binding dehydrogenase [Actinomadura luzonensis]MCK2214125.1 zinc-binding dehydrogenase [Actinomadura luzonensis]
MRAVVLTETGGPEQLKAQDVPRPVPGPGQLLIRAHAAGVGYAETQIRAGTLPFPLPLPAVLGAEAVGEVVETGDGVAPELLGTVRVGVTGGLGAYAEYVLMPAALTCPVPEGVPPLDALALAAPGAIALALLHRAGLRGGESVLVEAATSSVGTQLVRHAKEFGAARVIATAGSAAKRERAAGLGADLVLDHGSADWPDELPGDVDVVFDSIGGASARAVLDHLTPGSGRLLSYGLLSGEPAAVTAADLIDRGLTLIGCGGPGWAAQVFGTHYPEMLERLADGRSRAFVERTLPLEAAAEAHRLVEGRTLTGRVLLVP